MISKAILGLVVLSASSFASAQVIHCSVQVTADVRHTLDMVDGILSAQELQFRGQDSPEEIHDTFQTKAQLIWNGKLSGAGAPVTLTINADDDGDAVISFQGAAPFRYTDMPAFCIQSDGK